MAVARTDLIAGGAYGRVEAVFAYGSLDAVAGSIVALLLSRIQWDGAVILVTMGGARAVRASSEGIVRP